MSVKSPWTALEYCNDVQDFSNAWVCHAPESCGCEWNPTPDMLVLTPRGCKDMGSDALVALYAPKQLAPYVSLPSKAGGSTGYYSPTIGTDGTSSWVETAVPGCMFLMPSVYRRGLTRGRQTRRLLSLSLRRIERPQRLPYSSTQAPLPAPPHTLLRRAILHLRVGQAPPPPPRRVLLHSLHPRLTRLLICRLVPKPASAAELREASCS